MQGRFLHRLKQSIAANAGPFFTQIETKHQAANAGPFFTQIETTSNKFNHLLVKRANTEHNV